MRALYAAVLLLLSNAEVAHADPGLSECRTSDGAAGDAEREVVLHRSELEGFGVGRRCEQVLGKPPSVVVVIAAPTTRDGGAEQALNEQDGAARYIAALSRGKAELADSAPIVVLGQREPLYRMNADFSRFSLALKDAEVLTARVRRGDHNVVFWAVYPRAEAKKYRATVRRHFESARVTIAER